MPLGGGPSGIETLMLLVRDEPLPAGADVELAKVFRELPAELFTPTPDVAARPDATRVAAWRRATP